MTKTRSPSATVLKRNQHNQKKKKKVYKQRFPSDMPVSAATTMPACAHTLSAAPPTPSPVWLGPRAPWYNDRATRRRHQAHPCSVTSSPADDTAWTTRLHEYLDRDDDGYSAHIPPRVYNTVVDTARASSQTLFTRYGWVRTFAEYDAYAVENPGKFAYEMWFGHRGMARASLDARQALIRGASAYSDEESGSRQDNATLDDVTIDNTTIDDVVVATEIPCVDMTPAAVVDEYDDYGKLPNEAIDDSDINNVLSPQRLLECDDNDTF